MYDFAHLGAAVPVALKTAETMLPMLNNYTIEIYYAETQCDEKIALDSFISLRIDQNIDAVLGLRCPRECYITALLASQWNVPIVSPFCALVQSSSSRDPDYFNTFLGTSISGIGDTVVTLLLNFNWTRAVLVETLEAGIDRDNAIFIWTACLDNDIDMTYIYKDNKTEEDILQRITQDRRSK